MRKLTPLQKKVQELQMRRLASAQRGLASTGAVPKKKDSKPVGYKMQNTFERNLEGVPGGSRHQGASIVKMIAATSTGTKVRKEEIGLLRSGWNANTTQGSYVTTIVTEDGERVSDLQGRKAFGR